MALLDRNLQRFPTSHTVPGDSLNSRTDQVRKRIVNWILLIYWLLILEGILRKWAFPSLSHELFFIRDPFVLLVYFLAIRNGIWPRFQGFFLVAMLFVAIITLVVIAQLLATNYTTPLLAAYGWRNYFLYIPLAFIIRDHFRREDIMRVMKHTMLLALPIALLVTLQFFSPSSSWLNIQSFSGIAGHMRPAGTFSSVSGQWMFVVSLVAFIMYQWVSPGKDRSINRLLLYLATAAAFVCLGVGLSRGMVLQSGLVMLSAMFAGILMRGGASTVRAWVFPVVLVVAGTTLMPIVMPEAYEATVLRWTTAHATESKHFEFGILSRAFYGFVVFLSFIPITPVLGFGMGLGGNAARVLENVAVPIRAEDEWSRHIVDIGPIIGLLFILFRIAFTFSLGLKAVSAARHLSNPLPIILFGFIGYVLIKGQVTGHGTINGYTWIFVGLLMASLRKGQGEEPHAETAGVEPKRRSVLNLRQSRPS